MISFKRIILVTITFFSLNSLGIEIKRQNIIEPTREELEIMENIFLERGIKTKEKDLKKYLKENKILSNWFVEASNKGKEIKELLEKEKLLLEEKLAKEIVNRNLQKLNIDEEILKSYYITHKKYFLESGKIKVKIERFRNFDQAMEAYASKKSTKNKGSVITLEEYKIHPIIKDILKKTPKGNLTPPIFFKGKFIIFEIEDKIEPQLKKYEKVKDEIRRILLKKIIKRERERIVEEIKETAGKRE